jgi:hypothetical protein
VFGLHLLETVVVSLLQIDLLVTLLVVVLFGCDLVFLEKELAVFIVLLFEVRDCLIDLCVSELVPVLEFLSVEVGNFGLNEVRLEETVFLSNLLLLL